MKFTIIRELKVKISLRKLVTRSYYGRALIELSGKLFVGRRRLKYLYHTRSCIQRVGRGQAEIPIFSDAGTVYELAEPCKEALSPPWFMKSVPTLNRAVLARNTISYLQCI